MIVFGGISHYHAAAAEMTSNIYILSCCDIDKGRAKSWAKRYEDCISLYICYIIIIKLH